MNQFYQQLVLGVMSQKFVIINTVIASPRCGGGEAISTLCVPRDCFVAPLLAMTNNFTTNLRYMILIVLVGILVLTGYADADQRLVLIESQFNVSCVNSHSADQVLNQLAEDYPEYFVPVVYHTWWPSDNDPFYEYNPAENYTRITYYPYHYDNFYHTPYAWIDGVIRGGMSFDLWGGMMLDRFDVEAPLTINLSGEFNETARTGNLRITIIADGIIDWHLLKIRIALTEDSLHFQAPNGTVWHNFTMRDMIPDTDGMPVCISQGDTLATEQSFICPEPLRYQYCKLVVWVQCDYNRVIFQAARIKLTDLSPVSVAVTAELPSNFQLDQNYPNPFNASTTISFTIDHPQFVTLKVYDLLGREVRMLVDEDRQAGLHNIIFDATDLSSGIYFYRLQAGDYSESKRMVLLK